MIEAQKELSITEILDVCDVHLAFLCPGISGELRLKKCHGTLPTLVLQPSPPEFLAWTSGEQSIVNLPRLEGFVDSSLLQTYLNIKHELTDDVAEDAMNGGNMLSNTNPHGASEIEYEVNFKEDQLPAISDNEDVISSTDLQVITAPTVSPVNLRTSCVQSMLKSIARFSPMSLMECCLDLLFVE